MRPVEFTQAEARALVQASQFARRAIGGAPDRNDPGVQNALALAKSAETKLERALSAPEAKP